ncbi:hypothetical protein R3X25_00640 [Lutibacter sp. TH_r2]|uniref:hypothetical protein n=1 Tax=Lutibacter sp. TH_r2 TaxID=3082083 RepID=UPI002954F896|nr:hypothetical protein [Lutibacter sp. TH_r2]MDV7185772.1 hypothetical protein [Lutibacter sp. TH_r2]
MRKIIIVLVLLANINLGFAQKSVNNYKYIIVPNQFEFLKNEDQYQVNSLTKFLFERAGFDAYMASDITVDVVKDNCLALKAKVIEESSMFTTRAKIQLIDCFNEVVFETHTAKTKEKEFKKAYHAVVREAFEDIENLNYSYKPLNSINTTKKAIEEKVVEKPVVTEKTVEVEKVKKITKKVEPEVVKGEVELVNKKPAKALEKVKLFSKSILGTYTFKQWGKSVVSADGDNFVIKGGDENFEFAAIYKTSTPNTYIIKYVTYKQPRLLKITSKGNLEIDTDNGVEEIKRVY